jgi:hypothetical protein
MTTLGVEVQGSRTVLSSLQSAGTIPTTAPFGSRPTGQGTHLNPLRVGMVRKAPDTRPSHVGPRALDLFFGRCPNFAPASSRHRAPTSRGATFKLGQHLGGLRVGKALVIVLWFAQEKAHIFFVRADIDSQADLASNECPCSSNGLARVW